MTFDTFMYLFGIGFGVLVIRTGWDRYRTGFMPNWQNENERILFIANNLNFLTGRQQQKKLTTRQIRVAGLWYMALGVYGTCLAVYGLISGRP